MGRISDGPILWYGLPDVLDRRDVGNQAALAEAIKALIPRTEQGAQVLRTGTGAAWRVDVLTAVAERPLVVEYDGEYWHRDKTALDLEKTTDLLASGHLVARVRENDLPKLPFDHPRLLQTPYRPQLDTAAPLAAKILNWARSVAVE